MVLMYSENEGRI